MKKQLSKLRNMMKSGRNGADENLGSMADSKTPRQPNPLVVDKDGLQIVITHDNVEQDLLSNKVVRNLDEGFGIRIGPFINGVAEVSWELKPYKYYEMDCGVPGWEYESIAYAMIDEGGRFLEKFQYTDYYGLKRMRDIAEHIVSDVYPILKQFRDNVVRVTPEQARANRIPGDPRDYDDAFIEALEEVAKTQKDNH